MRYVQASNGVYQRTIPGTDIIEWDATHKCRAKDLTPEEAVLLEVSKLKLVTPPPFDSITQARAEIDPLFIDGDWVQQWEKIERPPEEIALNLANLITSSILQIDADTDAIYGAVLGHRAQEYTLAESEATAYAAAGYTGTVPSSVQAWATAKGWTAQQSADDILATATAWRGAQAAIREQRLAAKEAVRNATDSAGVEAAMATWAVFVTYIRGQLGL